MRSVSHKVIYIVLQFSGNSVRIIFSSILSEGVEQVKFSNIVKIHMALSKLRLTM